jgi:predicted RNA binding protein YcfA (HicA-like mRNA interferase family)
MRSLIVVCRRQTVGIGGRPRNDGETAPVPLKVSDVLKLLEADGWYLVAQAGSHRQFKHPAKPGKVTVAGKASLDLPPGTERSILKQAGIRRPR